MDLVTRVENLEKLVDNLIKKIDNNKFYQDADNAGMRQVISEVTPYEETKTAYIGDTEVVFENVLVGNLSVFVEDSEGNYPDFTLDRANGMITVKFAPLEYVTTITISIN